ncbi:hypothetical protein M0804_015020, partial [Polistes exclamans]
DQNLVRLPDPDPDPETSSCRNKGQTKVKGIQRFVG